MKDFLSKPELAFWIPIIILIVSFAVGWGVVTARLDNIDRRLVSAEAKIETQLEVNQSIMVSLEGISKDVQYIKAALVKGGL